MLPGVARFEVTGLDESIQSCQGEQGSLDTRPQSQVGHGDQLTGGAATRISNTSWSASDSSLSPFTDMCPLPSSSSFSSAPLSGFPLVSTTDRGGSGGGMGGRSRGEYSSPNSFGSGFRLWNSFSPNLPCAKSQYQKAAWQILHTALVLREVQLSPLPSLGSSFRFRNSYKSVFRSTCPPGASYPHAFTVTFTVKRAPRAGLHHVMDL